MPTRISPACRPTIFTAPCGCAGALVSKRSSCVPLAVSATAGIAAASCGTMPVASTNAAAAKRDATATDNADTRCVTRALRGMRSPAPAQYYDAVASGAPADRDASYRDGQFLVALARGTERFLPVERDGLGERNPKRFEQLLARTFLAVHARNLLDPPDPPITGLLDDCGEVVLHGGLTSLGPL